MADKANRLADDAHRLADDADRMSEDADRLADDAGGSGPESAQQVDAVDEVASDTNTSTSAASYAEPVTDSAAGSAHDVGGAASESADESGAVGNAGREITSITSAARYSKASADAAGGPASGSAENVGALDTLERDTKPQPSTASDAERSEGAADKADGSQSTAGRSADTAGRSVDKADGSASEAAQEVNAVEEVERNTKSQTTAASYTTTNHDVIRAWAEARGGQPAEVGDTDTGDGGVLRIEFRHEDNRLDEVDWDAFFNVFEDRNLAFLYQEKTSDGEISRFNKFLSRDA